MKSISPRLRELRKILKNTSADKNRIVFQVEMYWPFRQKFEESSFVAINRHAWKFRALTIYRTLSGITLYPLNRNNYFYASQKIGMQKEQAEDVPRAFSRVHSIHFAYNRLSRTFKLYSEFTAEPADDGQAPRVNLLRNLPQGFHTLTLRFQVKKRGISSYRK